MFTTGQITNARKAILAVYTSLETVSDAEITLEIICLHRKARLGTGDDRQERLIAMMSCGQHPIVFLT